MTRSSRSAPDPSPWAAAAIAREALTHWRRGAGVTILVASVLAFRSLHSASHVYESFVVFAPSTTNSVAADGRSERSPEDTGPSLEGTLRDALSQLEHLNGSADQPLAPGTANLQAFGKDRAILVCRADDAQAAYERCSRATTIARQAVQSLQVVEPAKLASRPLPAARDAAPVVLLASAAFGLVAGLLWMFASALSRIARPAVSSAHHAAPAPSVREPSHSSAPPLHGASASTRVSTPAGPRVEDERAWVRRVAESRINPAERLDPRAPGDVENRTVVSASVSSDWAMDTSLTDSDPDPELQRLCSHIADLPLLCDQFRGGGDSAECFVVGVTSRPEHGRLKGRLAARLAWLLSQNERARILLLETDLNHPTVDAVMRLAMPPGAGFSQQLQGQLDKHHDASWTVLRCTPQLSVLAEGRLRTPSMAYFPHFPAALASLRQHFDVIVAHGPAIDSAQTASAFEDLVDGIVFAVPPGLSHADAHAVGSQWFKTPVLAVAAQRGTNLP